MLHNTDGKGEGILNRKVLYVSSESGLGGANRSLCDMLAYIKEYVNAIVVIPERGVLSSELDRMNIIYYIVKLSKGFGKIGQHKQADEERDFLINYKAATEIKKIIEKEKIDLVHINSSVCNAGAMGAILAGIPYIWHIREIPGKQFDCEFWDMPLKKMLFCRTNKFLAISKCVQEEYRQNYGIASNKIYDGLDCKKYVQSAKKEEEYSFLVAGATISEEKGQLDVIKAVKILNKKGIDYIKVYIVGNYSFRFAWCLKRYIEIHRISNLIYLCPFRNDLSDLHSKCKYAIVPSKFEALGRVTVEAMLAKNIVIGANTGGTLEIIGENQERGYTYMEGNPESLAEVMLKVIGEDDIKKAGIKEKAQRYALHTYDSQKYAKDLGRIYEEVLTEGSYQGEDLMQFLASRYEEIRNDRWNETQTITLKEHTLRELKEKLQNNKENIKDFFEGRGLRRIAIYGMGELGCRLYDVLDSGRCEIPFVIDKNPFFIQDVLKVINPDDILPSIDAVVITAVKDGIKIKEKYREMGANKNIFIFSDILDTYEM